MPPGRHGIGSGCRRPAGREPAREPGRKAPMHKQRAMRTPLVAALGVLAFLVVPAAAQAHHIDATASCELKQRPTVSYTVDFIGFSPAAKPTTKGTVKVDGNVVTQVPSATINWSTEPRHAHGLHGRPPPARPTSCKAEFTVEGDGKWRQDEVTTTTNKCPPPSQPDMTIVKDGPGDALRRRHRPRSRSRSRTRATSHRCSIPVVTDDKCDAGHQGHRAQQPERSTRATSGTYTCSDHDHRRDGRSAGQRRHRLRRGTRASRRSAAPRRPQDQDPEAGDRAGQDAAPRPRTPVRPSPTIRATNMGNVHTLLDDVEDTTTSASRRWCGADATDTTFEPGRRLVTTPARSSRPRPGAVDNTAKVCGNYNGRERPAVKTVCDEDTHDVPSCRRRRVTPPTTLRRRAPRPADADTPSGGVLPETIASGIARLRGPSGCVKQAFTARVSGRSIASVAFFVDGKLVKRLNRQARELLGQGQAAASTASAATSVVARVTFVDGQRHDGAPAAAHVPPLRAGRRRPALHRLTPRRAIRAGPEAPSDRGLRRLTAVAAGRDERADQPVGLVLLGVPEHAEHEAPRASSTASAVPSPAARAVTRRPSPTRATP